MYYKDIFNFSEFERQLLNKNHRGPSAYICSPLRADTEEGVQLNMCAARTYMSYAINVMKIYARAPHAYLPLILNDKIPAQRLVALQFGQRVLELSDKVFVCGDTLTNGMIGEIARAAQINAEIRVFNAKLVPAVISIVGKNGGLLESIVLDTHNQFMALPPNELPYAKSSTGLR